MNSDQEKLKSEVKSLLLDGKVQQALDKLYAFFEMKDTHFAKEIFLLKQRWFKNESDNRKGIVAYDNYHLEINTINNSILYLIDQVPAENITTSAPPKPKRNRGKLLHDIPPKMPVNLETKCVVRIAEDEEILLEGFQISENTELEEIPISQVMEVELIDFDGNKNFEIRTFNSSEQTVEEDDYTQWLFFVKPINSGHFTLFLKVSIVQFIRGKERKKEIVLEKEINVVTDFKKLSPIVEDKKWEDTNIFISSDQDETVLAAGAVVASAPAPAPPSASYREIPKNKKSWISKSKAILPVLTLFVISAVAFGVFQNQNQNQSQDDETIKRIPMQGVDSSEIIIDQPDNDNIKIQPNDSIILTDANEVENSFDKKKRLEDDDALKSNKKDNLESIALIEKNEDLNPKGGEEEFRQINKKEEISEFEKNMRAMKKKAAILNDKIKVLDQPKDGGNILIKVVASGIKHDQFEVLLNKKFPLSTKDRDGNYYYIQLKSTDKKLHLTFVDKETGNSISQTIKGNTNYEWVIKRTIVGVIGVD